MARVFDIPRYHDQTLRRIAYFLNTPGFEKTDQLRLFNQESHRHYLDSTLEIYMGLEKEFLSSVDVSDEVAEAEFQYYCQDTAYKASAHIRENYARNVAKVMNNILGQADVWFSDEGAMKRLVGAITTQRLVLQGPGSVGRASHVAEHLSWLCFQATVVADKLGKDTLAAGRRVKLSHPIEDPWFASMWAWHAFRSARSDPSIQDAHSHLNDESVSASDFRRTGSALKTDPLNDITVEQVYYIQGINFVILHSHSTGAREGYALDQSAIEQICECITTLAGLQTYFRNYKLSGESQSDRTAVHAAFCKYARWLGDNMYLDPQSQVLAKHAKLCIAIMTNEYHPHMEVLDTHWEERSAELRAAMAELPTILGTALEVLDTTRIDIREALDIIYAFHIIPACDGRMTEVYHTTLDKYGDTNPVDEREHNRFIKYCKSLLLTHALQRYGHGTKIKCERDYDYKAQPWYRNCVKKIPDMPPESEWGKAWLSEQFHFAQRMEQEHYDAQDVTHVTADRDMYMAGAPDGRDTQLDSKELLYFLRHAPYLSHNRLPDICREEINSGQGIQGNIALIANKSENTKPGDAQRETLSANDVLRAYLSETDAQSIQVAALLAGASMRAPEFQMARRLDEVKVATRGNTVLVSLDVKGWSPNMDREHAFRVFDVIFECVTKFGGRAPDLRSAYRGLEMVLCRRGVHEFEPIPNGMIQGWTGTCDTIMHTMMTSYCIRKAKDAGLLPRQATGTSLAMIDDAVIVVNMPSDMTKDERDKIAAVFMDLVTKTYRSLGFIIEAAKTVCSSRVATYLNRIYTCGAEVIVPAKTFAKISAEHRLRFSGHLNRCMAMWATARGACSRGADPVVTYRQATYLFWIEVSRVLGANVLGDEVGALNAFFAPQYLGGYDCPTMVSMCTNEVPDALTKYCHVVLSFSQAIFRTQARCPAAIQAAVSIMSTYRAVMTQRFENINGKTLLSAPFAVRVKDVESPDSLATSLLKTKLKSIATSPVFQSAFEAADMPRSEDLHTAVLKSAQWDASLLACIAEYSPEAVVAPLVMRAVKSEILAPLLSWKERRQLQDRIRSKSSAQLRHVQTMRRAQLSLRDALSSALANSCDEAMMLRTRFHEHCGFRLENHTIPYPLAMIAHQPAGARDGILIRVDVRSMSSIDTEMPGSSPDRYRNMYDGFTVHEPYFGSRSSSAYMYNDPEIRTKPPLERIAVRALALCAYVNERSGHGGLLYSYILASWGIAPANAPSTTLMKIQTGVSPKRLASFVASASHSVALMPNAKGLVRIDAKALWQHSDRTHTLYDAMGVVNALRASVLIDTLCNNTFGNTLVFKWAVNTAPDAGHDLIAIEDRDVTLCAIEALYNEHKKYTHVAEIFSSALRNCGTSTPAPLIDHPDLAIPEAIAEPQFYVPRYDAYGPVSVDLEDGRYVAESVHIAASRWAREQGVRANVSADVVPKRRPPNQRRMEEETMDDCGPHYGPLVIAAKLVERESHRAHPKEVFTSRWSDAFTLADTAFSDPVATYDKVRDILAERNIVIDEGIIESMYGQQDRFGSSAGSYILPTAIRRAMKMEPDGIWEDRLKKSTVVVLLWLAMGRMPGGEGYRAIAAAGMDSLAKAHQFAKKRSAKLEREEVTFIYATSAHILKSSEGKTVNEMSNDFLEAITSRLWQRPCRHNLDICEPGSVRLISFRYMPTGGAFKAMYGESVPAIHKAAVNVLEDYSHLGQKIMVRISKEASLRPQVEPISVELPRDLLAHVEDEAEAEPDVTRVVKVLCCAGMYMLAKHVHATNDISDEARAEYEDYKDVWDEDHMGDVYQAFLDMNRSGDSGPDADAS